MLIYYLVAGSVFPLLIPKGHYEQKRIYQAKSLNGEFHFLLLINLTYSQLTEPYVYQ